MAGYSGIPLAKKLGLKPGVKLYVADAPRDYATLIGPTIKELTLAKRVGATTDVVHLFVTSRARLASSLKRVLSAMRRDAAVWVSWPKRASAVPTDITEDEIRALALPLGLVDIKVCAVDETWSGLKLVIRKDLRA